MELQGFSFRRDDTKEQNRIVVVTPEGESTFFWNKFDMGSLGNLGSSEAYLQARKYVAAFLNKMEWKVTNDEIISVLSQKCAA